MSDNNTLYRLVFTGKLLPGFSSEYVVAQLQKVLHLDKGKAEQLVADKYMQINKKLTLDRAKKLRLYILEQGAECVLLPIEESIISTQELPLFTRDDDPLDGDGAEPPSTGAVVDKKPSPFAALTNSPKKNMLIAAIAIIIASITLFSLWYTSKPSADSLAANLNSANEIKKSAAEKKKPLKKLSADEVETTTKLRNLSIRTSLWFADHGIKTRPSEISWIWIQGDLDISVKDMNDSWGNPIKYIGKKDGFEMRSSGADSKFYTDDDIIRGIVLE